MARDGPSTGWGEDGPEITDLQDPPVRRIPERQGTGARLVHSLWAWRRLALGLLLAVLVGALLRTLLADDQVRGTLRSALPRASRSPAALAADPTETVSAALPPPPAPPLAAPTALPGDSRTPTLDPAPASCTSEPPHLTAGGPPFWGWAVGQAPVLLGGFIGPYATMPLGPAATTMAYSWQAPHSVYGWPAPIGLILRSDIPPGPVTLSGWDVRTGHPLWFGFIRAGEWGPPARVVPGFTLDSANPSVPAGGFTQTETFWYGYAFLPGAGCYALRATWPGGEWRVTVSAGAVSGAG